VVRDIREELMEKLYLVDFTQVRRGVLEVTAPDPDDALTNAEEMLGDMSDEEFQE
jgi:hypothetical protein